MTNDPKTKNILVIGDWFVDENWIVTLEKSETSSHLGKQFFRSRVGDNNAQLLSLCGAGGVARLLHGLSSDHPLKDEAEDSDTNKPAIEVKVESNSEVKVKEGYKTNVYGMGFWEPKDTQRLAALFRSNCKIHYQTPHTLQGMDEIKPDDGGNDLKNTNPLCHDLQRDCLKHCLKDQEDKQKCQRLKSLSEENTGTWRVQRIFSQTGGRTPELLFRHDWEFAERQTGTSSYREQAMANRQQKIKEAIKKWLAPEEKFHIVVVDDHNKGYITPELIQTLFEHDKLQGAHWYIRSRKSEINWLDIVKSQTKLVFFGPRDLQLERDSWFIGTELSMEAISWLSERAGLKIEKEEIYTQATEGRIEYVYQDLKDEKYTSISQYDGSYGVVAFHDDNKIAAFIPQGLVFQDKKNKGEFQVGPYLFSSRKQIGSPAIRIGRGSVLFSALIWSLEYQGREGLCNEDFELALSRANQWCKDTMEELRQNYYYKDKDLNLRKHFPTALVKTSEDTSFKVERSLLDDCVDHWNSALNLEKKCLITDENPQLIYPEKFEIWRGWSSVEEYIAISDDHRKSIEKLRQAVSEFKLTDTPSRSLNIIVWGRPGWGKSFLVQRLAQQMDIEYREFNITSLSSISDLMSCFDTISSVQTQKPSKPLLVFWDEINAELAGRPVYSYFLGPIDNGVYRRGGQTFQLKPCIWVFAGTRNIDPHDGVPAVSIEGQNKASDFVSRINGPIIKLHGESVRPVNKNIYMELEQLYMSVSIIKRRYPEILVISKNVLTYFKAISPKHGVRSLEFIISKLKNVNHGKLNVTSLPEKNEIEAWVESGMTDWGTIDIIRNISGEDDKDYFRMYRDPRGARKFGSGGFLKEYE
ncbi:MAG: AAA family ATPase [Planctomycetes bacterium]|nr:AAA family ATPase [Planctomycetota bacterium]